MSSLRSYDSNPIQKYRSRHFYTTHDGRSMDKKLVESDLARLRHDPLFASRSEANVDGMYEGAIFTAKQEKRAFTPTRTYDYTAVHKSNIERLLKKQAVVNPSSIKERAEIEKDIQLAKHAILDPFVVDLEDGTVRSRLSGLSFGVGYSTHPGDRTYQEDRIDIRLSSSTSNSSKEGQPDSVWIGVYDGHGGDGTSRLLKQTMLPLMMESTQGNWNCHRVVDTFEQLDEYIDKRNHSSGSTATVSHITSLPDQLQVRIDIANIGDSRAILLSSEKDEVFQLTVDHNNGGITRYLDGKHLMGKGGFTSQGRVDGSIAVYRSLGNASFGDHVRSTPQVFHYVVEQVPSSQDTSAQLEFQTASTPRHMDTCVELPGPIKVKGKYVVYITASDGLYNVLDYMSSSELQSLVTGHAESSWLTDSFEQDATKWAQQVSQALSEKLTKFAIEHHSSDNVSVVAVVVPFKHTYKLERPRSSYKKAIQENVSRSVDVSAMLSSLRQGYDDTILSQARSFSQFFDKDGSLHQRVLEKYTEALEQRRASLASAEQEFAKQESRKSKGSNSNRVRQEELATKIGYLRDAITGIEREVKNLKRRQESLPKPLPKDAYDD